MAAATNRKTVQNVATNDKPYGMRLQRKAVQRVATSIKMYSMQ